MALLPINPYFTSTTIHNIRDKSLSPIHLAENSEIVDGAPTLTIVAGQESLMSFRSLTLFSTSTLQAPDTPLISKVYC